MTTLYVSDIKTSIKLSSRHLDLFRDNEKAQPELQRRLPLHCIDRVAVVGRSRVSMRAVHEFMRRDIPVTILEPSGRYAGVFQPRREGDALLRIRQYQRHESAWALACAKAIVQEKLLTSRRVLQRLLARSHAEAAAGPVASAMAQIAAQTRHTAAVQTLERLRGIEGAGSAAYFRALRHVFPDTVPFDGRNRRPPRDPVNALLSWTYSLIALEFKGAIAALGLDPCIGVYHGLGYNRPALALDLMEPFRAPLCDMFVIRLFNLGVLKQGHFKMDEEQGCQLDADGRKLFFQQFEKRMTDLFRLSDEKDSTSFRDLIRRSVSAYVNALHHQEPFKPFRIR